MPGSSILLSIRSPLGLAQNRSGQLRNPQSGLEAPQHIHSGQHEEAPELPSHLPNSLSPPVCTSLVGNQHEASGPFSDSLERQKNSLSTPKI